MALPQDMSQLQRAIADEYAAWYGSQDITQAPIVRRIVERHGMEVLPNMFFSLKGTSLYSLFMMRWLSLTESRGEIAFFETLLNIEREAILTGRKDTFLLLQSDQWIEARERFFEEMQLADISLDPVRVKAVELSDDCARVTLDEVLMASQRRSEGAVLTGDTHVRDRSGGRFEHFCVQDWAWKHTQPPE
jgi:hypothetical protein